MSRRRVAPWVAGAIALVVLAFVVVAAKSEPAQTRVSASPLLGQAAPPTAGAVVSGPDGSIDTLSGRWVLVNFFGSWCVPCRQEHPHLVRFALTHAADVAVLQVLYNDSPDKARAFLARNGGDWTVVDDPRGEIALDWGVAGLPETYLVNPGGVVVAKITGPATVEGLERLLRDRRSRG